MASSKVKPAGKKQPAPAASQNPSRVPGYIVGTLFNMAMSACTIGAVLLCLVTVRHFS
jgi:hypothetical protein